MLDANVLLDKNLSVFLYGWSIPDKLDTFSTPKLAPDHDGGLCP